MPRFHYTARSNQGERVEGEIEAPDRRAALARIEQLGHVPISVGEAAAARPAPLRRLRLERRRGRMGLRDVLLLTRELSDLLASGMVLGNALHTLARRKTKPVQDEMVAGLRDDIVQGASLSDALARRPDIFSFFYVNMVRAGEASGQLSEVLERLCRHYERVQEAREKVLLALLYPAIVLGAGLLTVLFAMLFVIPRFASIFEQLGGKLPLPTRILMGVSNGLLHYGWLLALLLIAAVFLIRRAIRTPAGRLVWDGLHLRIPLVRQIVTSNAYALFARTLGTLLTNGVPVLRAFSIVEDTMNNRVIARAVRDARERVTDGATIARPLAEGGVFPPLLTDMLMVGEESGDLAGALEHIAARYESELDRQVKVLTTVIEPVLILLMAVVVGFIALSLLLAVFDLTSGLNV